MTINNLLKKIFILNLIIIFILGVNSCSDKKGDPIRPSSNNYFAVAKDICSIYISYHKVDEESAKSDAILKLKEQGNFNPEIWATGANDGWAAFAYATDMAGNCKFGIVWNYPTEQDAKNEAISRCKNSGGEDPKIVTYWYD